MRQSSAIGWSPHCSCMDTTRRASKPIMTRSARMWTCCGYVTGLLLPPTRKFLMRGDGRSQTCKWSHSQPVVRSDRPSATCGAGSSCQGKSGKSDRCRRGVFTLAESRVGRAVAIALDRQPVAAIASQIPSGRCLPSGIIVRAGVFIVPLSSISSITGRPKLQNKDSQ